MAMHEYQKQMYKKVGVIVALILLPIAGFFAGMQYQKQTNPTAENGRTAQFGNGPRMMRNRAIGTVKSISDTSITVTERMNNEDKSYTLTSSTTYKNGTSDAKASDIKTGDTVLLTLDSPDNTKVTAVTINPTNMFRGTSSSTPSTDSSGGETMLQ
jgi:hypothetical protein